MGGDLETSVYSVHAWAEGNGVLVPHVDYGVRVNQDGMEQSGGDRMAVGIITMEKTWRKRGEPSFHVLSVR